MDDDHYDVGPKGANDTNRQPFKQQLPRLAEIQVFWDIRLFHRLVDLFLGQRLATRTQLIGLLVELGIRSGCGDASSREGDDVEEQQDDWVGDLQATLDSLGGRIGDPRQSIVGHGGDGRRSTGFGIGAAG